LKPVPIIAISQANNAIQQIILHSVKVINVFKTYNSFFFFIQLAAVRTYSKKEKHFIIYPLYKFCMEYKRLVIKVPEQIILKGVRISANQGEEDDPS